VKGSLRRTIWARESKAGDRDAVIPQGKKVSGYSGGLNRIIKEIALTFAEPAKEASSAFHILFAPGHIRGVGGAEWTGKSGKIARV